MKSQGTKETQGINGDAAALQRKYETALRFVQAGPVAPCGYPQHRSRGDWRLSPEHPVVCGVCHPPAEGLEVELVELVEEVPDAA